MSSLLVIRMTEEQEAMDSQQRGIQQTTCRVDSISGSGNIYGGTKETVTTQRHR